MKKEETNDIVQYLVPTLGQLGIASLQCKIDVTTEKSGHQRGDIWISLLLQPNRAFEKNIVALIEAKHRNCNLGDMDWRDAMAQGKLKAEQQGLNFFVVSNCTSTHRFYNRFTDDELSLDDKAITSLQPIEVLQKIQTQVTAENSRVIHRSIPKYQPVSEAKFRRSLQELANIYRSCGLKNGNDRIDPTVGFVILKYIGEQEQDRATLEAVVKTWGDYGKGKGNFKADFSESKRDIFGGEYGDIYKDFKDLVTFPKELGNEHYKKIYEELNQYHLHGCNFDLFGVIYEEFASQTKKKEFGEFYTRRHITGVVARLLLRREITGQALKICDPACGTGGFLTEAFKALINNYTSSGKLNAGARKNIELNTFWGFDNDDKSVARTKLNMFLAGDGHTNIYHIRDSLVGWHSELGWQPGEFDYILANPPMGQYDGEAAIEDFQFTSESRFEQLFLEKIVLATKSGGEIAIVVPDGMLEAPSREGFRKKLLDHCNVFAIVSLTRFAFAPYTKEKTYVLFMQKKQKDEIGQKQKFPIWHFIVDYDGFANSDKRFRTKFHNDLPELEEKFDSALKLARHFTDDREYFETRRADFERAVNDQEKQDELVGKKCGYVEAELVNAGTFHNLLSEFYLRTIVAETIDEIELDSVISQSLGEIASAIQIQPDESEPKHEIPSSLQTINDMFDYAAGNHGLTEEIIYEQQPTSNDESVPIFSGSQDNQTPIGFIRSDGRNNKGDLIKYFQGPCLILTKDGSAGVLTHKGAGVRFTINHHACVLKLKPKWAAKLHLKWFAHQYQNKLLEVVTSKSDNRVFSIDWFDRLKFEIPDDYEEQARQWSKVETATTLQQKLFEIGRKIGAVATRPLGS